MDNGINEVFVAVIVAIILGGGAYVERKIGRIANTSDKVNQYVLPHFVPAVDEHGIPHDDHTLPARVDTLGAEMSGLASETKQLRVDLVDHMKAEEELRVNDQAHRAMREARYDQLIEQLRAGNPEVRQ